MHKSRTSILMARIMYYEMRKKIKFTSFIKTRSYHKKEYTLKPT